MKQLTDILTSPQQYTKKGVISFDEGAEKGSRAFIARVSEAGKEAYSVMVDPEACENTKNLVNGAKYSLICGVLDEQLYLLRYSADI